MRTSELRGTELDYWTARAAAKAEGIEWAGLEVNYRPSTNWEQCGWLITGFGIEVKPLQNKMNGDWYAICKCYSCYRNNGSVGLSAQEAICRAVCASVYGEEVSDE